VLKRGKLLFGDEALQRLQLKEGFIAINEGEHFRLQHKKTAVNPAVFGYRLFDKAGDLLILKFLCAEAPQGLHRC